MTNKKALSASSSSSTTLSSPSESKSSPSSSSLSSSFVNSRWLPSPKYSVSSSSAKWRPKNPSSILLISFLLVSFSFRTTFCLKDVCQEQLANDLTAYYVCMSAPNIVFLPNSTNYKLTVSPSDVTCSAPQPYCTLTTPMQCANCSNALPEFMADYKNGQADLTTSWQSRTWMAIGDTPKANITVSLGRRFILISDIVFTFSSRRPKQAILEKSMNNGTTWTALQYYNYSCPPSVNLASPLDVVCTSKYSADFPSTGGTLMFEVSVDRFQTYLGPNWNNFDNLYTAYENTNFLEFLTFTDLRLRLIYPATDGQERSGRPQDKYKYYYAISNIDLLAGCDCNRHAKFCNLQNGQMVCLCEHNTAGNSCEMCLPLFNNRPWMKGSFMPLPNGQGNECQSCNCNGRASSCVYDQTINMGRCVGCTNNTMGVNCETCNSGFYKNQSLLINDPSLCVACNCEPRGLLSVNSTCLEATGQCQCKPSVTGLRCDHCFDELWGLLTNDTTQGTCKPCNCTVAWTVGGSNVCDQNTGQCQCVPGVNSLRCDLCDDGYYRNGDVNYQRCDPCLCDPGGSFNLTCDKVTGQCACKPNMIGSRCRFAATNFYVPLPDRISLKPDGPGTTCQNQTSLLASGAAFTGRYYFSCNVGQEAVFNTVVIGRQGSVIQTYIPAIRYTLNDNNPFAHATLTFTPNGPNTIFSAEPYPNLTSTACNDSYPVVLFNLFNMYPGVGKDWRNETGRIDLDARCTYKANFKALSGGATTAPFLLDSLVLLPDLNRSLVYRVEKDDTKKELYASCFRSLALYTSNVFINESMGDPCWNFSISFMAEQSGGALPCECSAVGSVNPTCSSLGGNCPCKVNVEGRKCDYCTPGFFGFSDSGCQACDCNSFGSSNPVCDYTTGQCSCQSNVALLGDNTTDPNRAGDRQCGLCKSTFYGISSGNGCLPCDCNPQGSLNLQCSEEGLCQCKPTFGGPKCDQCLPGYSGFGPDGCKTCNCSTSGSMNGTCTNNGQCYCKTNVIGINCGQCKDGTFGLSSMNPDGCQQCFCSGMSSTSALCHSAAGFRQDIISSPDTSGWQNSPDLLDYVLAPPQYLGDKRSSYGQFLNFTAIPMNTFLAGTVQYVILESTDWKRISYLSVDQSFNAFQPLQFSIRLHESQWTNDANPTVPLTAIDFYKLLSKLSKLMIQQRFLNQYILTLNSISLVSAAPTTDPNIPTIDYVENCTCSNNTAGFSCEKCQQGYKRSSNDSSASCVPCSCQRLPPASQICDEHNGQCLNCPDGSQGWSCEQLASNVEESGGILKCKAGFWGLSKAGCQACACSPIGSTDANNCNSTSGQCNCRPHVVGLTCNRCEDGYVNMTSAIGCSACSNCYLLVAEETKVMSEMMKNQSDVLTLANSSTTPDFVSRLVAAEANSSYLTKFNEEFGTKEAAFSWTLGTIDKYYSSLSNVTNSTLDSLKMDAGKLIADEKTKLDFGDQLLREIYFALLTVSRGFQGMSTTSDKLQRMNQSLTTIYNYMRVSVFPIQVGYDDLNATVTSIENLAISLSNNIINLTDTTNQAVASSQQLNSSLNFIEQTVNGLNTSSLNIRSQTAEVKDNSQKLIDRTVIVHNMVANLNATTTPDMQALNIDLTLTLPNRASSQQALVNNLLNQANNMSSLVQNVTQMTSALVARVTDFMNQVNSMTSRVVAANTTTSNAVNQSKTTLADGVNMLDVMSHFTEKSDALKSQATSAMQTAEGFTTSSRNALTVANNITASLDPILPLSRQALNTSSISQTKCQDFGRVLYPVRARSDQLKSLSDGTLNDVGSTRNSVLAILSTIGNENILALQRDAANQLTNRVVSLRSDADVLSRNVTSTTQRLADIANQLNSKIPLPTDLLRDMLSRCQSTKARLDQLSQSGTVQALQTLTAANQLWVSGLVAKRQELRTQLDRLKIVVGRLSTI